MGPSKALRALSAPTILTLCITFKRDDILKKYYLIILLSMLTLTTQANDDSVKNLNEYLSNKFDLNIELLSWLVINGKSNSTKPRKYWEQSGGIPWQLKELEKKGYIYIIIREYPEHNNQIGYSSEISPKAVPLLETLKEFKSYNEESILDSFEKESRKKHTTYISPLVKRKLLSRKKE